MVILIIQSVDSEEFSNVHFGSGHRSFRIIELFSTFDSFSAKSYQFIKQPLKESERKGKLLLCKD
jgi:hypothetical protein